MKLKNLFHLLSLLVTVFILLSATGCQFIISNAGKIAYYKEGGIKIINTAGEPLTTIPIEKSAGLRLQHCEFSPDGSKMLFCMGPEDMIQSVSTVDVSSGIKIEIIKSIEGLQSQVYPSPQYSSDGKWLLLQFINLHTLRHDLTVINLETNERKILYSEGNRVISAGWVPGTDLVNVVTYRGDHVNINVISNQQKSVDYSYNQISPNGKMAVSMKYKHITVIDLKNPEDTKSITLKDSTGDLIDMDHFDAEYISWSPDSKKIAISGKSVHEGDKSTTYVYEIYVADIESRSSFYIGSGENMKWSLDSTKIAYLSGRGADQLVTVNTDGTERLLLKRVVDDRYMWINGNRILYVNNKNELAMKSAEGGKETQLAKDVRAAFIINMAEIDRDKK